jgi:hypothetical protein
LTSAAEKDDIGEDENEVHQIFSYVSSVALPPITSASTVLTKKDASKFGSAANAHAHKSAATSAAAAASGSATTSTSTAVAAGSQSTLAAHMKDSFANLPKTQRMLVLLLWRVCSSSDPRPMSFLYHCVKFKQQGLLDHLDFLGASLPDVLSAAAAAAAMAGAGSGSGAFSGTGNAAGSAALYFSAATATLASVSSAESSPSLAPVHSTVASMPTPFGTGRLPSAAASASAHQSSPAPSVPHAAGASVVVGRCPKHRACVWRHRCSVAAAAVAAAAAAALVVKSPSMVGSAVPWALGRHSNRATSLAPIAAASSASAVSSSIAALSQLPGEMFRLLGSDFGHEDAHLLDDGLTTSEFRRNFEELGVLGKGRCGRMRKNARFRL